MENPFSSVMYVMVKTAGASCNLDCRYCYYLEKSQTLSNSASKMSEATLEEFIKQYIAAQTTAEVLFIWHGGEPLLRPISFYEKAIELQQRYAGGRAVTNCIQTNGVLLNEQWCRFLAKNGWLVGVSIDGTQEMHDRYRRDQRGHQSWLRVMRGIQLMKRYGVEWNAMAVVNDFNVKRPLEFYDFFKKNGCRFLQFTPIVERRVDGDGDLVSALESGELTEESVTAEEWGRFLCEIFDRWVRCDVGEMFVQIFDATLAGWVGATPGLCTMAASCGHAAMLEANGDLYSCDHFAFPQYRLGNIHEDTIISMMTSPAQMKFGNFKRDLLTARCAGCEYLRMCHGECPRNRFLPAADGGQGRENYLCEGYRMFFEHSAPYFKMMAELLSQGRAPAEVMRMI